MKKRILAFLLAATMLLSFVPQAVLAAAADSARTGDWTDVPEA